MPDLKIPKKIAHTIYLPLKESNYVVELSDEKDCTKSQLVEALINYYIATKDSEDVKLSFNRKDENHEKK